MQIENLNVKVACLVDPLTASRPSKEVLLHYNNSTLLAQPQDPCQKNVYICCSVFVQNFVQIMCCLQLRALSSLGISCLFPLGLYGILVFSAFA